MAVNETIVTGRKFRKLTDAASKKWQRISFWHKASDCEFNDGKTAEEKLGAIKGITTDLNVTVPGYAADATRVSELNNSLKGFSPVLDSTGKITGYKTDIGGADTVFPFSSVKHCAFGISHTTPSEARWSYATITVPSGAKKIIITVTSTHTGWYEIRSGTVIASGNNVSNKEYELDPSELYSIRVSPQYNGYNVTLTGTAYF